jgi:PTH1 family peptidyl-tRNA hydrolase
VAGLGNPGDIYHHTRHNAGFMAVDEVGNTFSIPIEKKKFDALIGRGIIRGIDALLVKPISFMNRSGFPIQRIASYFGISGKDMLIIHDDIDLALGRIKIKEKGGHGGHKGIESLMNAFGGGEFARLRIGVGRPENKGIQITDHVLGKFTPDEMVIVNEMIPIVRDAVVTFLCKGTKEAMNQFNNKKIVISN